MKRLNLRAFAVGCSFVLLAGCSSGGTSLYGQYYQLLKQSVSGTFSNGGVTRDQAAAIPYASIGYRLNGSKESILVLATDTNGDQIWTAKSSIVITTHNGRVIRTVGLPRDLLRLASANANDVAPISLHPASISLLADFSNPTAYGMAISCRSSRPQRETIKILGRAITTMHVDETCGNAALRLSYTNSYWMDPESGLAWRSIQHIHPKGDVLSIQVFRPPG